MISRRPTCSPRWVILAFLLVCQFPLLSAAEPPVSERLAGDLSPWVEAYQLQHPCFQISGQANVPVDGKKQAIEFSWTRYDESRFDLKATHADYAFELVRRESVTLIVLPKHKKLFWGSGEVVAQDRLGGNDFVKRVVRNTTRIAQGVEVLKFLDAPTAAQLLVSTNKLQPSQSVDNEHLWSLDGKGTVGFRVQDNLPQVQWTTSDADVNLRLVFDPKMSYAIAADDSIEAWLQANWPGFAKQQLNRDELERTFTRGTRRALEVLAPSTRLTEPVQKAKSIPHGELSWIDGQRVVSLQGTPEEIGIAHGKLLEQEANRCIDSVLYGFGAVQTIATGRWFREELEKAYTRLEPYIPERHKVETRALANALQVEPRLMETLNVFPELFHCSGFAVFGSATVDGKLYHGRVLDYMTTIGLQDAATIFIVAPKGQIPFVNVGYAGFVGSVSGMNAEKISLGEMGGKGEGKWDGVPMATLMRRALEECDSLDGVKKLWSENPRTCEYYYVFADGETKTAVGCAARPESIEFLAPGDAHPQLGEGIRDSVVMSAGGRLEELKRRVTSQHGKIDAIAATQLMCRPVAMKSNLHNVLFVPEDRVLYVANASHSEPAADRPYVRIDFQQQLTRIQKLDSENTQAERRVFKTRDSLKTEIELEDSDDAKICLEGLCWDPSDFEIEVYRNSDKKTSSADSIIRFPSALKTGDDVNDRAAIEWYRAKHVAANSKSPAVVVIHESGKGMTVGHLIARGFSSHGVHAFMLQLPHYGLRRTTKPPVTQESLTLGLKQGIADARRAYDVVRVLPEVDSDRIALQGTSLGGFVVATTTGLDPVYQKSFVLLAGGDLFGVLSRGERDAAKAREEFTRDGMSMDQLRIVLNTIEPLRLAHRIPRERFWLYSGEFDNVVPPENSAALAHAASLAPDHHVVMPANHYSGIALLPNVLKEIATLVKQAP